MAEHTDSRACVIALDVGGTSMKGAVLDHAMRPLKTLRVPTPRREGPEAVVNAVARALRDLQSQAAAIHQKPVAAGVVIPGIVDEPAQQAVHSVDLGWRDVPLAAVLEHSTGLPVTIGHDVRAGAVAESRLGAARGVDDALFVAIGTGISAAVLTEGRPLRAGGHAGELGHLSVTTSAVRCACGNSRCLETVASARAIAAAYTALSGREVEGAEHVAALVTDGDPVAFRVWERATDALAEAFAVCATLLAPEVIVIGGGLSRAGELLLAPLRDAIDCRLSCQRRPELVQAALGTQAGCLGAGLLAWDAAGTGVAAGLPTGRVGGTL
ncbi:MULTISPECIES: ROK family protein [Streptomyces]|uniref:ROK family transcriptional regulator n=1 Tax=Streptomyces viridochromogenes TaxID=1938 RepID=A0A0L8J3V5_STRVR|nr:MULTISPECIES: ROK family protein [Streptomyces]KOG08358.1 ROK family transcriptional regulator [Streptomyces viridochromogenes]